MCFCEPVSFAAGGVLIVGGAFAGWKALKINKRYFPVSQMPTLAGLQQFMEGHVWMGVNNSDPSMIWWAAMGFIFFSWLIWPVWVPFSIYFLEPPASRRKLPLLGFALAGLVFGLILFVPHLFHPDWVNVRINRQSLAYEDTMFLDYLNPTLANLSDLRFPAYYADHDLHLPAHTSVWIDADCHHGGGLHVSEFCLHIVLLLPGGSRNPSFDLHHR